MKKDKHITEVLFLIEKHEGDLPCNVFAFYPNENYYSEGNISYGGVTKDNWQDMKVCYHHIGQHSACHIDYAKECKEADYNEYQDLLKELIGLGYNLKILNKQTFEYKRQPTQYELKFGEGALHYRDFTLAETGITKKGDLKKWFFSTDDKLRYYR